MNNETIILGKVISLDTRNKILEAIWVKDGKIQYIGSKDMVKKYASKNAKILDYKNNYIYPGFIDAHCHGFYAGAKLAYFENLNNGKNLNDYLEIIKKRIQFDKDAEFYVGAGWIQRNEEPNYKMLDEIESKKPVLMLTFDGHSIWMNTPAMKKWKIDKSAIQKYGTDIIRVDSNGNPTGYISEGPVNSIIGNLTCLSIESVKRSILKWQEFAFSKGLTGYYEAGVNEMACRAYNQLDEEGKLKIRVFAGWLIKDDCEDYLVQVEEAKNINTLFHGPHFELAGLKIFMDGVVEAHTAWLLKPYNDNSKYYGLKRACDKDRVSELIAAANEAGFNVHMHAIGDGATHFCLDCVEQAQIKSGCVDERNTIAHLQLVSKKDIKRLVDLNVAAVVAPLWMNKDPETMEQDFTYIGPKRMFYAYPLQSFVNYDGVIAFHSDYPVSPDINPALSVYMACERNYPEKELFLQLNPHECISRQEALYALTYGPAWSVKKEKEIGLMSVGYQANFTVLDKDLLNCDINQIPKSKVVATIIEGEEVWKKEG